MLLVFPPGAKISSPSECLELQGRSSKLGGVRPGEDAGWESFSLGRLETTLHCVLASLDLSFSPPICILFYFFAICGKCLPGGRHTR